MPIGPLDRRKRRHRCNACITSHLKCSGGSPCSACAKRNQPCGYPVAAQTSCLILVDQGNTKLIRSPTVSDPSLLYFSYYDAFLESNKFTGLTTPQADMKQLAKQGDPEMHLRDAMLSLGAMQASKLCNGSESKTAQAHYQTALKLYTRAITQLRRALYQFQRLEDTQSRAGILWTTLLLGLFELMTDSSGDGWLQHLVHGTSQALVAGGPSTCMSGPCRRFFTESKVFEVCRAIVFNRSTFLVEERWMSLSAALRASSNWGKSQQGLDALLDIVVMCSSLRVQAADLIQSLQAQQSSAATPGLAECAEAISRRGFALRSQLEAWASAYHTSPAFRGQKIPWQDPLLPDNNTTGLQPQILAETFFSAASIYLSGVFDYEIGYWHRLRLPAPTLGEDEIQQHVSLLLASSQRLVAETSLSPLLLLFPLRVASARALRAEQRRRIMELLARVRSKFAVAGAIVADVDELWTARAMTREGDVMVDAA